jgi:hypothetical protein
MSAVYETTLRLNCRFRKLDPCVSTEEPPQRSEREVGRLRPKSQKIAAQRQISARQLSGMSGIFLRTGRDLQRLHWLAEDAVSCEPVSGTKFPANREINREFCGILTSTAIFESD